MRCVIYEKIIIRNDFIGEAGMVDNKVTVGLAITRSVKDSDSPFSELEKFTADKKPDVFLFPEDPIYSENINVLRDIAKEKQKWIICGMEDRNASKKNINMLLS